MAEHLLLALDSSTAICSVALYDGSVMAERTWRSERNHTRDLLPNVDSILRDVNLSIDRVTAVGVAIGPGTFSGLRVGLATAKMLAFPRALPLIGVGTLEATAIAHRLSSSLVRVLIDGGRGQVATALYDGHVDWRHIEEPMMADLSVVLESDTAETIYCGELTEPWIAQIRERRGKLAVIASPSERTRRSGFLAELAWQRLNRGEFDDPTTLQPLYLRRPAISTPRR
ncbi:MAG TPA: tRNA (adenosine(37)-N6)-threonylcarbamoyltransferase complex dimerization subunit type 1 TsaB [Chloroflexota bacterium]|nr:tRNA (adenosine(37)-N6)-threonylcarbamoyltransferase complex dimerization subunit type 1 TsaB [Chloroflexota bacterium]